MRAPDWEARLSDWIVANRDRPFEWGAWDCVLAAMSAVEAMTGEDPGAAYRGRYDTKEGAAQALRTIGAGTLLKTVDAQFERRPTGRARRGDLFWFEGAVGICIGGAGLFVGEERLADKASIALRAGLITIPRSLLTKAWTVE